MATAAATTSITASTTAAAAAAAAEEEEAAIDAFLEQQHKALAASKAGQHKTAAEAWAKCIAIAETMYPPSWPTLASFYRRAYASAKAAGEGQAVVDVWRSKFEAARRVCRGPQCVQCSAFLLVAQTCSRCKKAVYCSVDCQRVHWRSGHKRECRPPAA